MSSTDRRVATYVVFVVTAAAATAGGLAALGRDPAGHGAGATLPLFVALLVAGESLMIRFRFRDQVDTLNLMEAVLAPLLFAFTGSVVVACVFVAQVVSAVIRRNTPTKATFNVAQWTLAAGLGSLVAAQGADRTTLAAIGYLVVALAVVGVVNQLAVTGVLALVTGSTPRKLLDGLVDGMFPGLVVSWGANVVMGLLFALAYHAHAAASVLFGLPLLALHLSYRAAASARADRHRIAGTHRAIAVLTDPLDPDNDVEPFLREVAAAFESHAAALALVVDPSDVLVYRVDDARDGVRTARCPFDGDALEVVALRTGASGRARAEDGSPVGAALAAAGLRDAMFAVAETDGISLGVVVSDQLGLEGSPDGEEEFLAALARETVAALEKGRLLEAVLEERRKLAQIVTSTSDGILTLTADGTVRTWNPALEAITGLGASEVIGRREVLAQLQPRTLNGVAVELESWADGRSLPDEFRITTLRGEPRRLACSYSRIEDHGDGEHSLVVIARDTTPVEEMETLRAQFGRLAEAEAVQRDVVDRLQQAVMPIAPRVPRTEMAVQYVSSDPASPTGGDLYDWHILPSGDVHVAVIDVLGHGVDATRDALAVMHALRVLAVQGCPLEDLVEQASSLLASQVNELVATVVVCRYRPSDGTVRIAGGGHPSPLLASRYRGVQDVDAPGGAIGWPMAGSRGIAELTLEPGDALLFYTDGVVEAGKDLMVGTQRLMEDAHRFAHLPTEDYAVRLLNRALAGGTRRDDSLLLVLRRALLPASLGRWQLAPEPGEVRRVRRHLSAFARRRLSEPDIDQLEVVASELLTNAMRAARTTIDVELRVGESFGDLTIIDDGPGFELSEQPLVIDLDAEVDAESESGRGLHLVSHWTDQLVILPAQDGTIVRARLAWSTRADVPAAETEIAHTTFFS